MGYDIYCDFDIERHKAKYTNYLEVLVEEDGRIVYAVPPHQEKAMQIACQRHNCTREEMSAMCPKEYYFDYLNWLLMQGNAVAVWNDFCAAPKPNRRQIAALRRLKVAGLYKGAIPKTGGNFGRE